MTAHEVIAAMRAEIERRMKGRHEERFCDEMNFGGEGVGFLAFLDTLEADFDDVDPKHLVHQHIDKEEAARRIAAWILANPEKFNHGDIKEVTAEINALL